MTLTLGRLRILTATGLAASCLLLSACDSGVVSCQVDCAVETIDQPNLIETATAAGNFTTLMAALESSGLSQVLADDTQSFTVFAPTDAAFAAFGDAELIALQADTEALSDTLLYHVLSGSVNAETAIGLAGTTIVMQNNKAAELTLDGDTLMINNANVTTTDVTASNGIIHVIDAVLTPPNTDTTAATVDIVATLAGKADYSMLLAILQSSGLDDTLADSEKTYTVFAPTNAAFEAAGTEIQVALATDANALESILLGHVLPDSIVPAATALTLNNTEITMASGAIRTITVADSTVMIDSATVVETDIEASNGVIHGIDSILLNATDAAVN